VPASAVEPGRPIAIQESANAAISHDEQLYELKLICATSDSVLKTFKLENRPAVACGVLRKFRTCRRELSRVSDRSVIKLRLVLCMCA